MKKSIIGDISSILLDFSFNTGEQDQQRTIRLYLTRFYDQSHLAVNALEYASLRDDYRHQVFPYLARRITRARPNLRNAAKFWEGMTTTYPKLGLSRYLWFLAGMGSPPVQEFMQIMRNENPLRPIISLDFLIRNLDYLAKQNYW